MLKGGLVAVVLILMAFILTWILMDLVSVSVLAQCGRSVGSDFLLPGRNDSCKGGGNGIQSCRQVFGRRPDAGRQNRRT